jgi:hypothetical protein
LKRQGRWIQGGNKGSKSGSGIEATSSGKFAKPAKSKHNKALLMARFGSTISGRSAGLILVRTVLPKQIKQQPKLKLPFLWPIV